MATGGDPPLQHVFSELGCMISVYITETIAYIACFVDFLHAILLATGEFNRFCSYDHVAKYAFSGEIAPLPI
jgi:hypothetical protein